MGTLFGTDGIRGMANRYPLDGETALRAGRAVAACFSGRTGAGGRVLIGRDTRISGDMLVNAVAAGICAMGSDVYLAGVIPTPGIAYLCAALGFDAGIVISASHNPFYDNGIKLFDSTGYKLADDVEQTIEASILAHDGLQTQSQSIQRTGQVHRLDDGLDRYRRFLVDCHADDGATLKGVKMVIDCSNGAASRIAPDLFGRLGARVTTLAAEPNGTNINDQCGSQHPQRLASVVVAENAAIGLAFDGDADRLIAVDETGSILTGDQIMAICARHMQANGKLTDDTVVTTVMSNMGLGAALGSMGIRHLQSKVGDRYVMETMRSNGAVLGGEDSGHMIFLDHHTTGDGLLAALKLIHAMQSSKQPLSTLATVMQVFPQHLISVDVRSKPDLATIPEIGAAIAEVEKALTGRGRVLVRYSGTQPQCRVMVEGPSETETISFCQQIAATVRKVLG